MIATQRKKHLFIWICIGIFLPIIMVFAIKNRMEIPQSKPTEIAQPVAIGSIIKKIEHADFTFHLRGQEDISQLEIIIKSPLKAASVTVYNSEGIKGTPIGILENKNTYRFPVAKTLTGIVIYDHIKAKKLYTISF